MRVLAILFFSLFVCACQTGNIQNSASSKPSKTFVPENDDECCAHRGADGTCFHELIPGCATNEVVLPPTSKHPDQCCAIGLLMALAFMNSSLDIPNS